MTKRCVTLFLALAILLVHFPQIGVNAHAASTNNITYEMREEKIEFFLTNGKLYYKNTIEYPYFLGNSAAEVAINSKHAALIEEYKNNSRDFDAEYEEMLEWNPYGLEGLPFYDDYRAEVTYCENGFISIQECSTMWSGGMHSYMDYTGSTYSISTGQEITLNDILGEEKEKIKSLINEYKQGIIDYSADYVINSPFILTSAGLSFMCNVGDAVPRKNVVVPYNELALFSLAENNGSEGTHVYTVEEIEQMVADYFNVTYQNSNNPGKCVVFHGETYVSGKECNIAVRFQSSSNNPNIPANVLFAYVIVNMDTGVMTIEGRNGDTVIQLFEPNRQEASATTSALKDFNCFFVTNYYDNLNQLYKYDSVAQGILDGARPAQIFWNTYLNSFTNKEFIDISDGEIHPEYYYQIVLFEAITQTKLNDDYSSALTSQIGQISIEAASYFFKYDAKNIVKQKLNATMTEFSIDSVQYKRLSDYYGQYCEQLKSFDVLKDIYDLTVEADGSVEDFFDALSKYSSISKITEEIISALEYLKAHLELSEENEDRLILLAVNNILSSFRLTTEGQLLLNCLDTADNLLWNVLWAAVTDAFPQMKLIEIANFTIEAGLTLSNVVFPTTISADSYCKIYADYAIEFALRDALNKAYINYSANPSEELAAVTVGLYDLLGYTYAHEIEVAAVLSKQLNKDGMLNGLKNLFSSKNMSTYQYEQDCINAYEAYLNEILAGKVEAQKEYGLMVGDLQPVITVYFVNGKVASVNKTSIRTGDIYHVYSGEYDLPGIMNFIDLQIEVEEHYIDQQFRTPYEESPVEKPLSLYCNLLLKKKSDGTPLLMDHATGITVGSEEALENQILHTSVVTDGEVYDAVEEHFSDSKIELYDISMTKNGEPDQPSGEVTVTIPVSAAYSNRKANVYHVGENGVFENMNAERVDGSLRFTTTHFSYFVVVYENTDSIAWLPIVLVAVAFVAGATMLLIRCVKPKGRR